MVVFVERVSEDRSWYGETAEPERHSAAAAPSLTAAPNLTASPNLEGDAASLPSDTARLLTGTVPKARRMALLSRVVTAEILPRLALARQAAENTGRATDTIHVTTLVDTGQLVRSLLAEDASAGMEFIEELLSRGIAVEALYAGILPDAARWLGLMWEEDRCDFARVTIALGRLQQAVRVLAPRFHADSVTRADAHSVLLLPAPGEQHTFGLQILAEYFQRAGWRVAGGPKSSGIDAAGLVRRNWFDVVGFSVGSERMFDSLAKTIRQVKRASRNRRVGVMAGGPVFQQRPELAALAGADASAADAPAAVQIARDLVSMRVAAE